MFSLSVILLLLILNINIKQVHVSVHSDTVGNMLNVKE